MNGAKDELGLKLISDRMVKKFWKLAKQNWHQ